jgi:peroxiredoxin
MWLLLQKGGFDMQKRLTLFILGFFLTIHFSIFSFVKAQEAKSPPQRKIILNHPNPNPFDLSTVISYELTEPQYVETSISDRMGGRVAKDFAGVQDAGHHELTFNAKGLPWGVYSFSIKTRPSREAPRQGPILGLDLYYRAGNKHLTSSKEEDRAFNQAFVNVYDDPPRGVRMVQEFLRNYPDTIYKPSALNLMLSGYSKILLNPNDYPPSTIGFPVTAQNVVGASQELISLSPSSPNFHYVAQKLLECQVSFSRAMKYAKRSLDLNKNGKFFNLPYERQDILQTIGRIYLAQGELKKALGSLTEALSLCDSLLGDAEFVSSGALYERTKYLRPSILLDLSRVHSKLGQLDKAEPFLLDAFLLQPANKEIFEEIRTTYTKMHGSAEGFDVYYDRLNQKLLSMMPPKSLERLNRKAVEFELPTLDGHKIRLSDFKGKVVVLNFWGIWCGACKEEMPLLQELWNKYRDRGVAVLSVNINAGQYTAERNKELAEKIIAKNNLTFPILLHEGDLAPRYGGTAVPATYLIDQNGFVQYEFLGFDRNTDMSKKIDEKVRELLGDHK